MGINNFVGVGRLTKDPELKYTPTGTAVANFTVAINRRFNKEQTDFLECVAWRQTAEYAANYGSKGRLTAIEGEVQVRSYETNEGQKRKVTEIIVSQMQFLDKQDKQAQGYEADPLGQAGTADSWADVGKSDDEPY